MPEELIEEKFNKALQRLKIITPVDEILEAQLRLFFIEGLLLGAEHVVEKLRPSMELLKEITKI